MPYVLVRHKVKDYAAWKAAYDEHGSARTSAGLTESQLLRNSTDPSEVVVLFECSDHEQARALFSSDDLRTAMERSGVSDKPDIFFLEQA